MKVILEGLPGEIAALVEAIQDHPELRAIRRKPYEEMTAEDHARLDKPLDGIPTVTEGLSSCGSFTIREPCENQYEQVTSCQLACSSTTLEDVNRILDALGPETVKAIEDDISKSIRKAQGTDEAK